MTKLVQRYLRNEDGATMVEYGIMVALIAVVCLGAVQALGVNVNNVFTTINTALAAA